MDHIGQEVTATIGGKTYTFSRFSRKLQRAFLDWAATVLPNPLDAVSAKLKDFPIEIQKFMVDRAMTHAEERMSLQSPDIRNLMETPEGSMKIITLLFQKHHPELTDAQVETLYDKAVEEMGEIPLAKVFAKATGVMIDEEEIERKFLEVKGLMEATPSTFPESNPT